MSKMNSSEKIKNTQSEQLVKPALPNEGEAPVSANPQKESLKKAMLKRMVETRSRLLQRYPFYGRLLMHLQLGCSDCGTACTDRKHLLIDPEFASVLSDEEMAFVMLHEVLHCALDHCARRKSYHPMTFNIACDIVVNSCILFTLGLKDFHVNGTPAMHLVPDGREGFLFSAEEVYEMLLAGQEAGGQLSADGEQPGADAPDGEGSPSPLQGETLDSHETWDEVQETELEAEQWKKIIQNAAKGWSDQDIPYVLRSYAKELEEDAKVDWRAVLQDFIQIYHDRFDYRFSHADRRFGGSDFIIPSFSETEDERLEKLWFCVDTSGSISDELLSEVMWEIRQSICMFEHLSGWLSFFDTKVTEPVPFEDVEDFDKIGATGGGGTSFAAIFDYMKENMEEDLPSVVIVLTDGQCVYPQKAAALDVPVLWILYDNSEEPPWGKAVHIDP